MPGETSDVENLIKPWIRYSLLAIFFVLLVAIAIFFWRCSVLNEPQRPERNLPQYLLIMYSCCMVGYIITILSMDLRYKGSFCQHYISWRAGILCQILGVLFSFSTHGSFLVIINMSLDSVRNMVWSTKEYKIRYCTAVCHVLVAMVLAVLPLKGLGIFSTDVHFPKVRTDRIRKYCSLIG